MKLLAYTKEKNNKKHGMEQITKRPTQQQIFLILFLLKIVWLHHFHNLIFILLQISSSNTRLMIDTNDLKYKKNYYNKQLTRWRGDVTYT